MIQSRLWRDDWIINPIPSGIESQVLQGALTQDKVSVLKGQKAFSLAGISPGRWFTGIFDPPKKKVSSPCPPCLCGEELIVEKNRCSIEFQRMSLFLSIFSGFCFSFSEDSGELNIKL
jgi:hypothetical protein